MPFSQNIKIRIYFDLGDGHLRKFYWFKKSGDEFYWGNSGTGPFIAHDIKGKDEYTLDVPSSRRLESMPSRAFKFSYHATGQVHQTIIGEPTVYLGKWPKISDLKKLKCIYTVISKHFGYYVINEGIPTKRKTKALKFKMTPFDANTRHVFEFWVSPNSIPMDTRHRIPFPSQYVNSNNFRLDTNFFLFIRSSLLLDEQGLSPMREIGLFQNDESN